jgi:hypothetical protein
LTGGVKNHVSVEVKRLIAANGPYVGRRGYLSTLIVGWSLLKMGLPKHTRRQQRLSENNSERRKL